MSGGRPPLTGWPATMRGPKTVLRSDAPGEELIAAVRGGLERAGFRVRDRPPGFRARRWSWWSLLAAEWPHRTLLQVMPVDGGAEIRTDATWFEFGVSRRAGTGLRHAAGMLQARGWTLVTDGWVSAPWSEGHP